MIKKVKGALAVVMSCALMAGIVLPLSACSARRDKNAIMMEE